MGDYPPYSQKWGDPSPRPPCGGAPGFYLDFHFFSVHVSGVLMIASLRNMSVSSRAAFRGAAATPTGWRDADVTGCVTPAVRGAAAGVG